MLSESIRDNAIVKELMAADLLVITLNMLNKLDIAGSEYVLKLIITKTETKFAGLRYRAKADAPKIHPQMQKNTDTPIDIKTVKFENVMLKKLVDAGLFPYSVETNELLNIEGGYFVVTLLIDESTVTKDALEYRAHIEYLASTISTKLDTEKLDGHLYDDAILIKNYGDRGVTLLPIYNFTYNTAISNGTGCQHDVPVVQFSRSSDYNSKILKKIIKYKKLPRVYNDVLTWYE